tara:strand:- start:749 stop:1624 length:876 start_codon:yes stop_codon:yes gene_type:complete
MEAYYYALGANFSFALGSIFFTHYARKFSSIWMNTFKASVAALLFAFTVLLGSGFHEISALNFGIFFVSGFVALGLGDIFLINAFSLIGPGRTLVLFGFHPMIVGILSYFILGQEVSPKKLIGIIFFIGCLLTFSLESFRKNKSWGVAGLSMAILGVTLDGVGVIITRYAFDMNTAITALEGNFHRCLGALCCYALLNRFYPMRFVANFREMRLKSKLMVSLGAIFGTYLSLGLYLEAVKTANLAIISSISITSVLFSSVFESLWNKEWPSKYLYLGLSFFGVGIWFVMFA